MNVLMKNAYSKSKTLQVWESLNNRMELQPEHKKIYLNQLKGGGGELFFMKDLKPLPSSCLVLHDLWLRFGSTAIQVDAMVLSGRKLHLYEVKNYSGTFYYDSQQLFLNRSEEEVFNPLHQVEKNRILLKKFLQQHGFPFEVTPYIVFVNPDFHMYQSPRDQPFLFRSQLENHLRQVAAEGENFSHFTKQHRQLAEKLMTLRYEEEVRYENFPTYTFASLRKGVSCRRCHSFSLQNNREICVCLKCGHEEKITKAISRTVNEFQLLFPDMKITKKEIYHWCGAIYPEQRIKRVLGKEFHLQKDGKNSFYL